MSPLVDPDSIERGQSNVMKDFVANVGMKRANPNHGEGGRFAEGSGGSSKGPSEAQRAEVNGHVEKAADAHIASRNAKPGSNTWKQKNAEAHFHAGNGIKAADKAGMPRTAASLRAYASTSNAVHLMDASGRSGQGNPNP